MANIRGQAQPFIKKAIGLNLGANETFRVLRQELGATYRRQDFLQDFRRISGEAETWKGLRNIKREAIPSLASFKPIKPTWDELFEYRVRVTGIDDFTGDRITRYTSYRSNERLSRNQLLERIIERFGEGVKKGSDSLTVEDVLGVEGYANARLLL